MGNKVNPVGMRLQVNRTWDSRWFANSKDFGDLLLEDIRIKDFIKKEAKAAGISRVIIERPHRKCRVTIHAARPGVIIGRKGADIDYALSEASTPYGIIGVKVWIFKGEIMEHDPQAHDRRATEAQEGPGPRGPRRDRDRDAR